MSMIRVSTLLAFAVSVQASSWTGWTAPANPCAPVTPAPAPVTPAPTPAATVTVTIPPCSTAAPTVTTTPPCTTTLPTAAPVSPCATMAPAMSLYGKEQGEEFFY